MVLILGVLCTIMKYKIVKKYFVKEDIYIYWIYLKTWIWPWSMKTAYESHEKASDHVKRLKKKIKPEIVEEGVL